MVFKEPGHADGRSVGCQLGEVNLCGGGPWPASSNAHSALQHKGFVAPGSELLLWTDKVQDMRTAGFIVSGFRCGPKVPLKTVDCGAD